MRITVTQHDIDNGSPASGWNCPVAIAIARAAGVPSAWVCGNHVEMPDCAFLLPAELRLPLVAVEFVFAFDAGATVRPIEFDL